MSITCSSVVGGYTTILCAVIHLQAHIKCLLPVLSFLEDTLPYYVLSSTYKSRSNVYYLFFSFGRVHYHIICCHPPISPDQMSITCSSLLEGYTTILCAVIHLQAHIKCLLPVLPFLEGTLPYYVLSSTYKITCSSVFGGYTIILCAVIHL
jgi:hypothetical protein